MQINSSQWTVRTSGHLTKRALTWTTCLHSDTALETSFISSFLQGYRSELIPSEREREVGGGVRNVPVFITRGGNQKE